MAKGKYQQWLEPDGLLQLEAWARDGLTDEQLAKKMEISTATLYNYKRDYLEILEALKRGKDIVDVEVENALLKRAKGYKYNEITQELTKNEDGEMELAVTKVVTKEVIPDTTAQIFWLKNRRPDMWRDKKDVAVEGQLSTGSPYDGLTVEELRALAKECENKSST